MYGYHNMPLMQLMFLISTHIFGRLDKQTPKRMRWFPHFAQPHFYVHTCTPPIGQPRTIHGAISDRSKM